MEPHRQRAPHQLFRHGRTHPSRRRASVGASDGLVRRRSEPASPWSVGRAVIDETATRDADAARGSVHITSAFNTNSARRFDHRHGSRRRQGQVRRHLRGLRQADPQGLDYVMQHPGLGKYVHEMCPF